MASWKQIAVGTGIAAVIGGVTTYVLRLRKMSVNLESIATASVHSISLSGLVLRIDVQLKNPSRTGFSMKFPFVKLVYNGNTIGSSAVINKDIKVPANGEVNITQIMVSLPAASLLLTAGKLLTAIAAKEPTKLTVKTLTTIDLGWKKIPYEKTDDIQLIGEEET